VCFEVLGFDIMFDHKLTPWLIEVNHSPSFGTDTPLDKKVKHELMVDTFRLLNLSVKRKRKLKREKQ
jgi:tubulin polyglutamylase TTLL6/13